VHDVCIGKSNKIQISERDLQARQRSDLTDSSLRIWTDSGGMRHAQAYGRPADAAFFCYGNEIAETPEVHFCYTEIVWVRCAMVLDLKSM
jgi:hypothetical protein